MYFYTRRLFGFTASQFVIQRLHVGGFYQIKPYMARYVMGLKSKKIIYDLLYLYFFIKKNTYVFSNSIRSYYDKILFINSHPNYAVVFRFLCELIDMPFLYTKWAYGTLSNFFYFYKGASRIVKNGLEGFYDLNFIPALTVNLNGLYNFASLKEGRTTGSLVCGIMDYDMDIIKDRFIFFDKHAHFNYFFMANDDNVKALNYVMFLIITAIFYRKLWLYSMFNVVRYLGKIPYFLGDSLFPTKALYLLNGSYIYFYKNYGSPNFLRRFYWYRSLRDYYFFYYITGGNFERLSQQFISTYSYHVSKKLHFLLFFKQWIRSNKNFYFFNLQDFSLTQQLHMIFLNIYTKKKYNIKIISFKKKVLSFKKILDKLSIVTFFVLEKFSYKQLTKHYLSLIYAVNLNVGLERTYTYFRYAYSFSNIHGYKILTFYKRLIRIFFFIHRNFQNINLDLYFKLRNIYNLLYNPSFSHYQAYLYSLKKKITSFYYKYFFYKWHLTSFKLPLNFYRNFFVKFTSYLKYKRFYFTWSFKIIKFKYRFLQDYRYYYHFLQDQFVEQTKRILFFQFRFNYFFKYMKKNNIKRNCLLTPHNNKIVYSSFSLKSSCFF